MGIVFILVRKKWGVTIEILKRSYLQLGNVSNKRRIDLKGSENKSKMLYSINQS